MFPHLEAISPGKPPLGGGGRSPRGDSATPSPPGLARARAAQPREERDRGDLLLAELLPADPARPDSAARRPALDHALGRHDQVDAKVVRGHRDLARLEYLDLVHGRAQTRVGSDE